MSSRFYILFSLFYILYYFQFFCKAKELISINWVAKIQLFILIGFILYTGEHFLVSHLIKNQPKLIMMIQKYCGQFWIKVFPFSFTDDPKGFFVGKAFLIRSLGTQCIIHIHKSHDSG